jgi:putative phosphoesterase
MTDIFSMRLAAMADIHGNLPALEAVLHDVHSLGVDGLLVAGDMTCGPNSAEVLQRLVAENAWMVLGNNEGYLLRFETGLAPRWWHTSHQWALNRLVFQTIDRASLDLLRNLPEQLVIELPGTAPIRLFHGSLRSSSEMLDPRKYPEPLLDAFTRTSEAVLICGHTHLPWQERRDGRRTFNPGAVTFPCNGVLEAQFAILTWSCLGWEVEFHSVPYDHSLVRKAFMDSGFLQGGGALTLGFLLSIETGRDVAMEFLAYAYQMAAEQGYPDCEYVPDGIWDTAAKLFNWEREAA